MKIIVVGINPTSKPIGKGIPKNPSLDRLNRWMNHIGIIHYSFMNTYDEIGPKPKTIDSTRFDCIDSNYRVVALGSFVSKILVKNLISHIQIPHPSPLNRQLNDKSFEINMLHDLNKYVNSCVL